MVPPDRLKLDLIGADTIGSSPAIGAGSPDNPALRPQQVALPEIEPPAAIDSPNKNE